MASEVKLCGDWMDNYWYLGVLVLEATCGMDTVVMDARLNRAATQVRARSEGCWLVLRISGTTTLLSTTATGTARGSSSGCASPFRPFWRGNSVRKRLIGSLLVCNLVAYI